MGIQAVLFRPLQSMMRFPFKISQNVSDTPNFKDCSGTVRSGSALFEKKSSFARGCKFNQIKNMQMLTTSKD